MRAHRRILVGALPVALAIVNLSAEFDGLVGSGGIDAEGCFAVQPVVRAAQTEAFG